MNVERFADDARKSLLLILGISLGVKLVMVVMSDILNPDAVRYINAAHELWQGDVSAAFAHEKMLGFVWLLGLIHLLVPDWFLAGKILSALPLVLASLPLYLIARDLFGARAALATGLMFSVMPYVNGMATEVIKGPLFLLCLVTSLWLVMRGLRRGQWPDLLGGSLCALLGILFRVEGLVYLVTVLFLLGFFACAGPGRRVVRLQQLLVFAALPVIMALLGAAAVLAGEPPPEFLMQLQGQFGGYFSPHLLDSYLAIYQHLESVEPRFSGGQWSNDFFELARYQLPLIYLVGLLQTFAKALFPIFLLPLACGLDLRRRWGAPLLLLLGVIAGFLWMDYLFLVKNNFISSRYLLIPVVLALVIAGHGLVRLLDALAKRGAAKFASVSILVLGIMVPAAESFSLLAEEKTVLKSAGQWLEQHYDPERSQMMTNNEEVAFYAGLLRRSYQVFPPAAEAAYEAAALRQASDLVVLELPAGPAGEEPVFHQFKLLKEFADSRKKILVYERIQ